MSARDRTIHSHLADRFGGPVIGVEPFDQMRERAQADAAHERVEYRAGCAEALPLVSESVDGALLFFVWHHVADRPRAAAELRRVIRVGGSLLIRTPLADALPERGGISTPTKRAKSTARCTCRSRTSAPKSSSTAGGTAGS